MAQGYDPAKAALFNKLIQDGLSEDAAAKQAGITEADFGTYVIGLDGKIGPLVIGVGQKSGVNNTDNFDNEPPASSVKTTTTTTITTSGGGTTTIIAGVDTPTPESKALQEQINATSSQIDKINRQLAPVAFGGTPNLTADQRATLQAQRAELYDQWNAQTDAAASATLPGTPTVTTTPNTTTTTTTTQFSSASSASPVGANDTQQGQEQIYSTSAPLPANQIQTNATDVGSFVGTPAGEITTVSLAAPVTYGLSGLSSLNQNNTTDVGSFVGTPAPVVADAVASAQASGGTDVSNFVSSATPVGADAVAAAQASSNTDSTAFTAGNGGDQLNAGPSAIRAGTANAQNQPAINNTNRSVNNTDWRVRLSLANGADYLYSAADAASGILSPLRATNGIIFPYTPTISTSYKANYNSYDLTHSNYRGYFYQNSYTDSITVTAAFTAQNTQEANYLLAVIHFFRSVTKMFYGQSSHLGSPPPICYLNGLGEFQFNQHPVLVSQFNYSLPADVDYIRAGSSNNLNLPQNQLRAQTNTVNPALASVARLASAFLTKGAAQNVRPPVAQPLTNSPTYVPTKMEIVLTLLPVQSRQQVSQVFNLDSFANGSQLTKGFW